MVLQVPFDQFVSTIQRVLEGPRDAYVSPQFRKTIVTASAPGMPVVVSVVELSLEETQSRLENQGVAVYVGRWNDDLSLEHETDVLTDIHVAGVSYKTEAGPPGIWIDAFCALPTQVQVLKAMYDEMTKTGEMAEVTFEEFVRVSEANVVILTPSDLRSFIAQKESS